jgi:phytoene desaturase
VPFSRWTDMAKLAPQLMRLGSLRSVYGMVAKYVRDERLRTILSFHPLLVGGNPFAASSIYSLICFLERRWGVHFAMGGTGRLVDGLAGLIRGQGGQIICNAEVAEILVKDGAASGVRLKDGTTLRSDIVVSNACSATTYKNLIPAQHRRRWTDKRIARGRYSMSLFVWYFGTRRQYKDVAHHTILLGPRYRELLDDIFNKHHLAEDFSLYLHRPTATDPSLAPEGCDAFYVLSPVPHLGAETDWTTTAETYRRSISTFLGATILPGLEDQIASSRMMTPIDFSERLLSYRGAAFGLEPLLTQSAWFRPHNASEELEHLYLVGAGTHPGAGLPGVSARILDRVVPDAKVFA